MHQVTLETTLLTDLPEFPADCARVNLVCRKQPSQFSKSGSNIIADIIFPLGIVTGPAGLRHGGEAGFGSGERSLTLLPSG